MTAVAAGYRADLVFILGFPRSGTTLLGQILASDPGVALVEEKPLLAQAIADFVDAPGGLERLAALSGADLEPWRADFWRLAADYGVATDAPHVVEQTALNTVYLPLIARLFAGAPVVFAVRDPRDVVLSCFRRQFAPSRFTLEFRTLESTARFYDATMKLARSSRARFALNVLEVRNEDVIADFDAQTRRLCAFTGIPWRETMRDFQRVSETKTLATRSAAQMRGGLSAEGVGIWRRYHEQMEPVLDLLAPWVRTFGYEPS